MEQFAGVAGSRCQGYWLLSCLFLDAPTSRSLAELREALPATDAAPAAMAEDIASLRDAVEQALADPEAAAVEFTRRLVAVPRHGGESLPFESHVLEGRSPGEATAGLLRRMAAWGYAPVVADAAPPDHLGAQLRLMALLCHDEREAWHRGDATGAREALRRQEELLSAHLSGWAPRYCMALASWAAHAYVQAIGRLTVSALQADMEALKDILRQAGASTATAAA